MLVKGMKIIRVIHTSSRGHSLITHTTGPSKLNVGTPLAQTFEGKLIYKN